MRNWETDFCDVTLACEEKHSKAHKLIVSGWNADALPEIGFKKMKKLNW